MREAALAKHEKSCEKKPKTASTYNTPVKKTDDERPQMKLGPG